MTGRLLSSGNRAGKGGKQRLLQGAEVILGTVLLFMLLSFPAAAGGWVQNGSVWNYYAETGQPLYSTRTPDGFYVDENGSWLRENYTILGQPVISPSAFIPAAAFDFPGTRETLNGMNRYIQNAPLTKGKRIFHLYQDGISYARLTVPDTAASSGSTGEKTADGTDAVNYTETKLLSLTRDALSGEYLLRISTNLGGGSFNAGDIRSFDYSVFQYFCCLISNRPSKLMDAVYESWQGKNRYGINMSEAVTAGDCRIRLAVEEGTGIYRISAAGM